MKMQSIALGGLVVVAATAMPGQASAASFNMDKASHGTASCQSALPAFDVNLRKRPPGVINLGPGSTYVTCDFDNINSADITYPHHQVSIYFSNVSAAHGVVVDCTLVDGFYSVLGNLIYLPKRSNPIDAGYIGSVSWVFTDNGGDTYDAPAVSCLLPAGVEISAVRLVYAEEIGS